MDNKKTEYKTIDLSGWHQVGEGANSDTYMCDDDNLLLKLFKRNATEDTAVEDYTMAKKVASLGIVTAAVYEIVKVGDKFGVIYQNIKNKKSYSRLVADDPENIREYVKLFAAEVKELHSTPCDTELFESRVEMVRKGIDRVKFIKKYKPALYELTENMAGCTTCLHGDLQSGNLIRSEGKNYWIDFDRFSYGDPLFDIAHMYNAFVTVSWLKYIQNLMHMDKKTLNRFWDIFVEEYAGLTGAEAEEFNRKLAIYDALDLIQRSYVKPGIVSDLVALIMVRMKLKKYYKYNK